MTFRQFLEYGTQGMGPGASGARGAAPISGNVSQIKPAGTNPKDLLKKSKQDTIQVEPSPMSPRGLGAPMQPPKAGFSGGGKWKTPEFSPMSLGTKWKVPDFSPFSSKNKWAPRKPG